MQKSMMRTIMRKLVKDGSTYIPVDKNGQEVIRLSNHLPTPKNLFRGKITGKCKNIYLIFVKSMIDKKRQSGFDFMRIIQLIESNNPKQKTRAETKLNNFLFGIGNDIKKGINYQIIDGNSEREIEEAIDNAVKMLKTTAFSPLQYIPTDN